MTDNKTNMGEYELRSFFVDKGVKHAHRCDPDLPVWVMSMATMEDVVRAREVKPVLKPGAFVIRETNNREMIHSMIVVSHTRPEFYNELITGDQIDPKRFPSSERTMIANVVYPRFRSIMAIHIIMDSQVTSDGKLIASMIPSNPEGVSMAELPPAQSSLNLLTALLNTTVPPTYHLVEKTE